MAMWTKRKTWAVIGAGHGGQALAAYLALKGEKVSLYNRTPERLDGIRRLGGIHLEGIVEGFGRPKLVTSDLGEALDGAGVVMVVVPASAHNEVAQAMAPHVQSGQSIILNPGRTLGAVAFAHRLREADAPPDVVVAETDTFIFASRRLESGRSCIRGIKRRVRLAALPAIRTGQVLSAVRPTLPQFVAAGSVLETGLSNIGAIFHPAPALLNVSRIESALGFDYYSEGITGGVARALEALDAERMEVARSFRVTVLSAQAWLATVYGSVGETLHKAIQNTSAYIGLKGPESLNHRYIFEDVPTSLVPLADLARVAGRRARVAESLVTLAGAVTGVDWEVEGRTLASVGLGEMTVHDIREFVTVGLRAGHRRRPGDVAGRVCPFPREVAMTAEDEAAETQDSLETEATS